MRGREGSASPLRKARPAHRCFVLALMPNDQVRPRSATCRVSAARVRARHGAAVVATRPRAFRERHAAAHWAARSARSPRRSPPGGHPVNQLRRAVGHAPAGAARAGRPAVTREGDEQVVTQASQWRPVKPSLNKPHLRCAHLPVTSGAALMPRTRIGHRRSRSFPPAAADSPRRRAPSAPCATAQGYHTGHLDSRRRTRTFRARACDPSRLNQSIARIFYA